MPRESKGNEVKSRHAGTILWIYRAGDEDRGEVTEALFRSAREIAIDCRCNEYLYTMVLKSSDGVEFTGECRGRCDGAAWKPTVGFKLWSNPKGSLLFGEWIEEGDESYCVIELYPK